MPPLSEDEIDDILYFARTNDLEQLRETLVDIRSRRSEASDADVFRMAVDPGSGNTALHLAAANGHVGMCLYCICIDISRRAVKEIVGGGKSQRDDTQYLIFIWDECSDISKTVLTFFLLLKIVFLFLSPDMMKFILSTTAQTEQQQQHPNPDPDRLSSSSPSSSSSSSSSLPHLLPTLKNASGNTPLHWASLNGHTEGVRLLVEHGADSSILNDAGHDAVFEAERNEHGDVVRLLLGAGGKDCGGVEREVVEGVGDGVEEMEGVVEGDDGRDGSGLGARKEAQGQGQSRGIGGVDDGVEKG